MNIARLSLQEYEALVEQSPILSWRANTDALCDYFNERWLSFRGRTMEQEYGNAWAEGVHPDDFDRCLKIYLDNFNKRNIFEMEYRLMRFDGEYRWIFDRGVPFYKDAGEFAGYIGSCIDVTERVEAQLSLKNSLEQEIKTLELEAQLAEATKLQYCLQEQAFRDSLTGLYNRRYLEETLPREISRAKREEHLLALIMIDIDHFKKVNDTFGHAAGDEVLKYLSSILSNNARESDIICRYGGEEFLVVLPGMSLDNALQRVESWRILFSEQPFKQADLLINVTFSAGISVFPEHSSDADKLIALADDALYLSKREGRNCVTCAAKSLEF
jgi:diguanylate cyclase (GGDEF)-like protein/PAS domain S-box-containing protein